MRTIRIVPAMAAAACLLSLGCSTQTTEKSGAPREAQDAASTTPFRIIATDTGFVAPDSVPAGLRHIVYENHGTKIHEAMLVKLAAGMSPIDYVDSVKAGSLFPGGALDYSGPGLMSPGETTEVWSQVDPGEYILICWNDGHDETDPVHPFTVLDHNVDDAAPKADAVLKLVDFQFVLEGQLHKGPQVIRVETPGPSMHECDLFRLHEGKTIADLNRWRKQGGAAPAHALGGVLDSHDVRRVEWLRKDFTPGRYAFHCEMPAPTSRPGAKQNHADFGMVREFEIAN